MLDTEVLNKDIDAIAEAVKTIAPESAEAAGIIQEALKKIAAQVAANTSQPKWRSLVMWGGILASVSPVAVYFANGLPLNGGSITAIILGAAVSVIAAINDPNNKATM